MERVESLVAKAAEKRGVPDTITGSRIVFCLVFFWQLTTTVEQDDAEETFPEAKIVRSIPALYDACRCCR